EGSTLWVQVNGFLGQFDRIGRIAELRVRARGGYPGQTVICARAVRVDLECLAEASDGFLPISLLHERDAKAVVEPYLLRTTQSDRLAIFGNGLVRGALLSQSRAEFSPGSGDIFADSDRLAAFGDALIPPIFFDEGIADVEACTPTLRTQYG